MAGVGQILCEIAMKNIQFDRKMKRYIVLSVNDNPDYLYFAPLTCWAWRKFGWEPIVMYRGIPLSVGSRIIDHVFLNQKNLPLLYNLNVDGYRSDTITQISRLYAACVQEGYLMTGDIDMIPLSDYFNPDQSKITVYGHDLTGFGHYPICYIGMTSDRWKKVMHINTTDYNALIKRDLDSLPQAKDPDFYKYWFTDQDLITERLKPYEKHIDFVNRGQLKNGYARGRVDRGAWSLEHEVFIDAHLFHQVYHKGNEDKFEKTMELLCKIWPDEDWCWFEDYTNEFRKLTGHAYTP